MTNPRGMNTKIHVSFRDACAIYIVPERMRHYRISYPCPERVLDVPEFYFFFNKHLSVRSHPSMMNISFAFAVFPARLNRIKQ